MRPIMAVIGYVRVSTDNQTVDNQKLTIHEYANKNKLTIDRWVESRASSRKSLKERKIDELLRKLKENDILIVAELSRLGRSVGQIAILVDKLIKTRLGYFA